jgi:DNA polymerase
VNEPLSVLAADAAGCTRCRLAQGRTQVVFGVGNPDADLLFIGEAPGFHEDKQGEPFVGAAGQLLTTMLTEIVGLRREDVYICNVLKCRPPGNRDPQDDEVEACTPWLIEQVSLIQPRVIGTLGNFATKFVLNTHQGITRMRGAVYPWHGRTVIPTFHPAAILRGGGEGSRQFADFRDDFGLIRDTLASPPAAPRRPEPAMPPGPKPAAESPTEPARPQRLPDPVEERGLPAEATPIAVTVPLSPPQDDPVPEGQLELF